MMEILLIDDDEVDRKAIRRLLARSSLEANIAEAKTGQEGIELALKGDFDCVFLDFRLPDMDGLDVLEKIVDPAKGSKFSVVMLTGMNDDELAHKALEKGAQDFLVKDSITQVQLMRAAKNAIEKRKLMDQHRAMLEKMWRSQNMEAVGKATANIAKEFETLWQSMELALKPLGYENFSHQGAKHLNNARAIANRGGELVGSLLKVTDKTGSGEKPCEANRLVKDCQMILENTLGEFKTLKFKPIPRRRKISVDSNHFQNALLNLVSNASEGLSPGGTCTLEIQEVHFDPDDTLPVPGIGPGDYIRFNISDNGAGLDQATIESIMQAYSTGQGNEGATGFGFSMVADFVKKSKGGMKVSRAPGGGTSVDLVFPVCGKKGN